MIVVLVITKLSIGQAFSVPHDEMFKITNRYCMLQGADTQSEAVGKKLLLAVVYIVQDERSDLGCRERLAQRGDSKACYSDGP
jgi:hypothetical protein